VVIYGKLPVIYHG